MDTYSSLGQKLTRVIQNEAKCRQFQNYLKRSIVDDQVGKFTVIDESSLVTVEVQQKCYKNVQIIKSMSPQNLRVSTNQNNALKNLGISMNVFSQTNNTLKTKQIPEIESDNEFLDDKYNINEPNGLAQVIQDHQNAQRAQQFDLAEKQTVQFKEIQDEYFQLNIINESILSDQNDDIKSHQVKIFQSSNQASNPPAQKDAFNLSNFSSFNGVNSQQNLDSQKLKAESDFYQKQFVYLVKKIEMIQGKKLSQKGISKVAEQLQIILPQNPLTQISLNKLETKKITGNPKIKNVPKLNFSKKPKSQNNNEKLNSDSNTEKKVKYETNIGSQLKSKSKPKNPVHQIHSKVKHQSNKQNIKMDFESEKQKQKKQTDRSVSPLSYKVLMQKKKNQKQKSQQRRNKIQASKGSTKPTSEDPDLSYDLSNQSFTKHRNLAQLSQSLQYEKQSTKEQSDGHKKSRLKIILENQLQGKMKTLSFEYLSTGLSLQREVQSYCMKNKIQSKNIKSICQALSQHKPILTIKQ